MTNPETGYEKAHRQVEQIFRQFFPARGMVTREGQIRLCHMMLDALFGLDVALCDAGVGLGKTYAYLVACVLWQLQRPRQMQRPVVISTASVALQSAILTEYIPFLSNVLIQNGYIQKPICAVLRKGKERFACDRRLLIRQKQIGIRGERFRRRAAALHAANQCLDLDLLPGISRHDRRLICVPERCSRSCILHSDCRYRQYLKDSNGASVTIQVCNHNYLLADAAHRQNGWKPLLKDYQALVIDEAHKLPETVRQMNTRRIRSSDLLHFERILTTSHCTLGAQKLRGVRMAFLTAFAPAENESEREKLFCLTAEQSAALQHLDKAIQEIFRLENKEVPPVLRNKLSDVHELIPLFLRSDTTFVRYAEYHQENGSLAIDLCAVPFDLPQCVYDALWREQKPAILTSGTLAVGEDFTHTEQQFGLDRGTSLRTLRIPSPFHYENNCLLYKHFCVLYKIRLKKLEGRILQEFYNYKYREEGLSAKTLRNYHMALHKCLQQAVKERLIVTNPCDAVTLPSGEKPEIAALTNEQQRALVQISYRHRYGVFVRLDLSTGLRMGELLALRWEDIDLVGAQLTVKRTINRLARYEQDEGKHSTEIVFDTPKTQNARRTIPLTRSVIEDLKRWRSIQLADQNAAGAAYQDTGFVVTNELGMYFEQRTFKDYYNRMLQDAGIGHFTFHALRHTFATRALERGMDYKTLSAILGHYSVSFTMDTYVHSMDEHKRNEMDKMDDLFGISLEISVEQQPYPVLFTVTEEGCKAFAPDFPKIQIQAGTMETALMEAKKQIQKALSQFKYPPIPTRQEDIVVPENSVLILLKTA